jgi:REP element-mobilizing transposase RayT
MANTYSQIYIHIVFAVMGRQNLISQKHKEELHKYITGIITNNGQKLLEVNVMPDHTHILISMEPDICISDLVRDIKSNSSGLINDKKWVAGKFSWQKGFGVFSYSHSQLDSIIKYINNQESHHKKKTFKEEYVEMLEKFYVKYDDKYLFEWII